MSELFGRNRSTWQAGMVAAGLSIVAIVLIAPRAVSLMAAPTADVAPSGSLPVVSQITGTDPRAQPAAPDPAVSPSAAPARVVFDPSAGASVPAAKSTASTTAGTSAVSSLSVLPTVAQVGKTLFSDSFVNDPLGNGVPAGWALADPTSTSNNGLLGGLLGLLPGTGQVTDLLPSIVNDPTHVLDRASNSWSHLSAGSAWVDYTVTAGVKTVSVSTGFAGVAGRFQSASTFLTCGIQNGSTLELLQVVNGQQTVLASKPLSAASNAFHTIAMDMQGSSASCSLDGTMLLHTNSVTIPSGKLGLIALGSLTAEFDAVTATTLR